MLRAALAEFDPTVPVSGATTLDEIVGDSVAARRFTMLLLAALAVVALILALAGIYGVSQRRYEMGLRMALGATGRNVLRLVMLQGMRPVVIGLVIGIGGALSLSRLMDSLLFGMTSADLPTYAAVAALLAGAAALACYIPARDALRVDVTATLKNE